MLTDSHCHLYVEEFENDRDEMISRARAAGVEKFYLPAIDSETTAPLLELEEKYPGVCIPMMGLHPCSVKDNYLKEMEHVKSWLAKRKFAAVGEIGLDFYWDKTFIKQQYEAFNEQVELAIQYQLPIVIHTRDAMAETIEVVSNYKGRVKGIFHCFGGSLQDAEKIIGLGFYMGIGGVVTYKNSGLASVISQIGLEYLVLETDAPYLTPVPYRGKRNESSYLPLIAQKIAESTNSSVDQVAAVTTRNAQDIFGV